MRVTFWLLDLNYEVKDDKPEVWLWGIDDKGNRVLVVDRSFYPYFYLLPKSDANLNAIFDGVKSLKTKLPLIKNWELVDRRYFGRVVKAVKVTCENPDVLQKYSAALKKVPGVEACLEDDIRFSMRYLIDNDVNPCSWLEMDADEAVNPSALKIDKIYNARSPPNKKERFDLPELRILSFTMTAYGEKGSPRPALDPVIIISVATNTGKEVQFTFVDDDRSLLEKFKTFVMDFDPDIVVGYGSNQIHWPYLISRSSKLGMSLSVDREAGTPHTSVYGHISVTGRVNVDLYDFADEFPQVKVKTLENLSDFLGVMRLEERTVISEVDIPIFWKDTKRRSALLKSSLDDVRSIRGISEALIDYATQLSQLVGVPLDHVATAATGFKVDWYLIRRAFKIGELAPSRGEYPYFPFEGGLVLAPKPGIHDNVAVLDFKSMYPNIMISKNVSPDTYIRPGEQDPPEGVNIAPEVGHRFRKAPPGFYGETLKGLIKSRDELRGSLGRLERGGTEYRVLDSRQKAVKVITNAVYGYAGWLGARWYLKPVAEAAAAWGRDTIKNTIKFAEAIGLRIIYGDTDSIFVINDPTKVDKLSRKVREDLGLEIKPDTIYKSILFTEAKKRYAGLTPEGRLDIVGLEVIRGDWASVAKNVQEEVLGIVLREKAKDKAVEAVKLNIRSLLEKKRPYRDLIIWKTLTKPIEDYKVKTAHVEAAKMLKKDGWDLALGDKVGYVVTLKGGKLYEKAKPYNFASYDEIDLIYYVDKQVKPAALRILEQFGVSEDDLNPEQQTYKL